jgi:phenylpyruvate tautomerase PptA (4-oxalocrotonate tautomerase family)
VPVVEITALPQAEGVDVEATLKAVALALADVLDEPPHGTWALWKELDPGRYAEGGDAPARQPAGTHPPFVRLLSFEGRSAEQVEAMLTCVAEALARELRLEAGNVFVRYEEASSGRLFDGGRIVTRP